MRNVYILCVVNFDILYITWIQILIAEVLSRPMLRLVFIFRKIC